MSQQNNTPDATATKPVADLSAPAAPRRTRRWLWAVLVGVLALPLLYLLGANLWLLTSAHELANRRPQQFQADWSSAYTLWPGRVHFRDLELRGRNRRQMWSASLASGQADLVWAELFAREVRLRDLQGEGFRFRIRPRTDLPADAPDEPDELDEPGAPDAPASEPAAASRVSASPALPPIEGFEGMAEPIRSRKAPWSIHIEKFVLDDVQEVWIERFRYVAEAPGGRFSGSLVLRLRRSVELPQLMLELADGRVEIEGRELVSLETGRVEGALLPFVTRRTPLLEFSRYLKANLDLVAPDSDLSALEYYLRGSPVELGGRGRLEAHLALDQGRVLIGSRLEVAEADLQLAYLTYWGRGRGAVKVAVEPMAGPALGPEAPGFARLLATLDDFELGVLGTDKAHLRGTGLEIEAETTNLDLGDPRPILRGEVRLPATEVPDFSVYNQLWPKSFPLELLGGKAEIESRLSFDTREKTHSAEGSVKVHGRRIRARFLGEDLAGDFSLEAKLESQDLASRQFDLRGARLKIENLDGRWHPETTQWWANIELTDGHLDLGENRGFDLGVTAELADTSPLVAALLAKKPGFDWLSRILEIDRLRLKAKVKLARDRFDLRRLHIEGDGDRLVIDGEVLLQNKKADGAFRIEYGPLSAAVRIHPGGDRDWKLLKNQAAYDAWLAELRRKYPR